MNIITWNTNRWYGEHGQRMAATQLADGAILFTDIDRGIDGIIKPHEVSGHALRLDKSSVMYAYDRYDTFTYWAGVHMYPTELAMLKTHARLHAPEAEK